jgi:hypothetical protein
MSRMKLYWWLISSCAVLIAITATFFAQQRRIEVVKEQAAQECLLPDWETASIVLGEMESKEPIRAFDSAGRPIPIPRESERAFALSRVIDIFALADLNGQTLQASEDYKELGVEAPKIQSGTRLWNTQRGGKRYLLYTGRVADRLGHQLYQVTIGRPVA